MYFEQLLGSSFAALHPKLQQRYRNVHEPFYARGVMTSLRVQPAILKPVFAAMTRYELLFPESGKDVPFTFSIQPHRASNDQIALTWIRHFHFPHITRTFTSTMQLDLQAKSAVDYLGRPARICAPLQLDVTANGSLQLQASSQLLLCGSFHIPLFAGAAAQVTVVEGYDDEQQAFTIEAAMQHPLLGTMLYYAGYYNAE